MTDKNFVPDDGWRERRRRPRFLKIRKGVAQQVRAYLRIFDVPTAASRPVGFSPPEKRFLGPVSRCGKKVAPKKKAGSADALLQFRRPYHSIVGLSTKEERVG